ncbi:MULTISPECIES: ABC transporter ATP-binding protein [Bacillaceae]|uniref:ABC transporter ATP-binding protein n=1 Tax=Bacillaceae TaxID=186817 RepID=UPI001E56EB67|nr:ATP-binding cassette domain-containing protein [Bacillus sp. Au-Bac7]MCE4048912.1 ATP-binding cassette domain-containing protein [Bacillus sp. Au-Bac7]
MHAGIKVHDLTVRFGETTVLNNISLSFEKNKIHGLVGRNGSGKTILLKCICGFVIPASGSIKIDDQQIGQDCDVPENIGIIIEAPGFLPNYDGYTNLKFLAAIKKQISKEQILHVIEKVGLDSKSKKHVGKYSLGMRQRLGLAQALMEDPDILILDEPMNGLDNQGVKDIRTILLELKNQGKTILLASHSKEDIEILCDTVHELDLGKIINSNTKF